MTIEITIEVSDEAVLREIAYGMANRASALNTAPGVGNDDLAIELRETAQAIVSEYE